jgi:hypothetical protein
MKKLVVFFIGLCVAINVFSASSNDEYNIPNFIQELSDEQRECKGMSAEESGVDKILKFLTIGSKGVSIVGQVQARQISFVMIFCLLLPT